MLSPLEGSFFLRKVPIQREYTLCCAVLSKAFYIERFVLDTGLLIMREAFTFTLPKRDESKSKNNFRKAGGAVMRVKITLACSECKQRNYNTMKNKKNDPDRLEMNKYCRFCRKHTLHKETK